LYSNPISEQNIRIRIRYPKKSPDIRKFHPNQRSPSSNPDSDGYFPNHITSLITDNGTQFTGKKFLDFCEDHHIHVDWAAVAHPMTNGQVERANGMILQGLKPRIYNDLNKFGKRWIKEVPSVVWSLMTTPS
jgi:transposase InsO family protein